MPVTELNHYFVRAGNLEATKDFYCKALDLQIMPRPPFPFPGYWLGREGRIWVHMGQDGIPNAELYYRGTPKNAAQDNSGVVDHIAFLATDPEGFRARFGEMRCEFWAPRTTMISFQTHGRWMTSRFCAHCRRTLTARS